MTGQRKHQTGSLIGAFALLIALLVAGAPAHAHGLADAAAVRHGAAAFMTSAAGDHVHTLCHHGEGTRGPCCCQAGACSLAGCLLPAAGSATPVVFYKATYDLFIAPRPDTPAAAPDLPPPR